MRYIFLLSALLPFIPATQSITCTNDFTQVGNKCLRLFTTPTSRTNASRTCTAYAGSLDNFLLSAFVRNATDDDVWIGLYCFDKNMTNCLWDSGQGSAEVYNNFVSSRSEGNPFFGFYKCVYYKVGDPWNGHWLSADCRWLKYSFVCEIPTTFDDDCALNFNGSCYISSEELINSTQSFGLDSAQRICQENDGDLISIHSANENRLILNYYKGLGLDSVLLGAVVTKHFFWMDDSHWDFSNIDHTTDEYGTCLKMALQNNECRSKGSWYITPCEGSHHFMCKRPAGNSDLIHVPKVAKSPPSQCNKVLLMSGTFSSPTYPENCMYTLKTLDGQRIRITFQTFYVTNGYIQIVEEYQGAEMKQKFSGTSTNLRYTSLTNELKVMFITEDLENMDSEFVAKFFSVFDTE